MLFNFKDSTLHHTASFDSNTLSLAAMASSSRSKASTKGRPQPKHGKKTAVRPSRLFTRRRPTCRATSPESIGEQIEVQLERHFTFQAHPSPGESSVGSHPPSPASSHVSYVSHADLSVHSSLLTIPLNHVPIMNDARHQQEVGPSMKHLKPRYHLKVILISTMPP